MGKKWVSMPLKKPSRVKDKKEARAVTGEVYP